MQIFSQSQTHSYQCREKRIVSAGFTLVELLVSIAIIGVITGVVLVRHASFDGTVLLKSAAYEIALSLRDTQVKSVSALRGANNSFDYPYGMTFTPGSGSYVVFKYSSSTDQNPYYDIADPAPVYASGVSTSTLGRSIVIEKICITTGNNASCDTHSNSNITRLDVAFKRPNFEPIFSYTNPGNQQIGSESNMKNAKIILKSENGESRYVIEISKLGQMSVYKQ